MDNRILLEKYDKKIYNKSIIKLVYLIFFLIISLYLYHKNGFCLFY